MNFDRSGGVVFSRSLMLVSLCAFAASSAAADPAWTEGADVTVASGTTVTLTSSTPRLKSLTVSGTLALSNWTTRVNAETVTVAAGGVIKPVRAFTDAEMSNRVWIACDALTVASGGKINADALGYKRGCGPCWAGVSSPAKNSAGAYGGAPGKGSAKTYGSVEYPADPGSGGIPYNTASSCTLCGGGAIRLEVSGNLIVDGQITAVGSDTEGHCFSGGGEGSGGGIWITCKTIDGSGEVLAHGTQSAQNAESAYALGGGGGGRIAVHYDTSAQSAKDATCHVRFDARGGSSIANGNFTPTDTGRPACIGGLGTLYFTDGRFLTTAAYRQYGWRFAGQWKAPGALPETVNVAGDFLLENCALKLPIKNFSVGGNLTVNGTYARNQMFELTNAPAVSVGGNCTIAGGGFLVNGGSMTVGGDLLVDQTQGKTTKAYGGELWMKAAATNGTANAVGFRLNVNGKMTMAGYSLCWLFCHPTDGAIPELTVGELNVGANGWITADAGGFGAKYGPGYLASQGYSGGAYGGYGGSYGSVPNRRTYGDAKNPVMPGSGSGERAGGGVIKIQAGRMRIDGKVTADSYQISSNWVDGGSGGSVWLKCYRFLTKGGQITAKGGTGCGYGLRGGGGRIALSHFAGSTNTATFAASKGGGSDFTYLSSWSDATDGTVYIKKLDRMMVIIR